MNITYFQVRTVGFNFGFKLFVTVVDIYAATNSLWPWTTFQ